MTTDVLPLFGCLHVTPGQKTWPVAERCTRQRTNGAQCKAKRTIWPTAHIAVPDPQSCWKHMSEQEQRACNRGRAECLGAEPQCAICGKGWERMTGLIVLRGGAFICDDCFEMATEELEADEYAVSRERD